MKSQEKLENIEKISENSKRAGILRGGHLVYCVSIKPQEKLENIEKLTGFCSKFSKFPSNFRAFFKQLFLY